MGSTFYTELRTSAYVVQVQRDAFYGLAKGVTAPNLACCPRWIYLLPNADVVSSSGNAARVDDVLSVAPVLPSVVRVGRGTSGA